MRVLLTPFHQLQTITRILWLVALCTSPPLLAQDERAELLAKAEASTQAAAEKVKNDPSRPTFHILPPANWMNDPNGPLYHNGFYHLFYQYNPYGDEWGNMHWGHVRGKDLAHWERQPIALWPSKSRGEEHVFSGSATIRKDGTPILFYTSIGNRNPEQWAAIPEDAELTRWKKHPDNPILTEALHGDTKIHEWRDPYVFEVAGKTHMVCGGNLNASQGGKGVVTVYRADNEELTKWTYLGILFHHPDAAVKNVECPIFFPIEGKWVLIVAQGQPVDWFVGTFDETTMRFTPETRGKIDYGQVYAPSVLYQAPEYNGANIVWEGERILWGWINGVPGGKGWRHCQTLPRTLSLDLEDRLVQKPNAPRGRELLKASQTNIANQALPLESVAGPALEIEATFAPTDAKSVGLDVLRSADGTRRVPIRYNFETKTLSVFDTRAPLALPPGEPLDLRVFVDHSIIEVYAHGGRVCLTRHDEFRPDDIGVAAVAEGGTADLTLSAWEVPTIWVTP